MSATQTLLALIADIDASETVCPVPNPDSDALVKIVDLDDWHTLRDGIRTLAAPQVEMVSDEMVGAAVNSLYAGFAGERITLPPTEIVRLIARHALQAALNARAGGDGWLPIESAPSNGYFLAHSAKGWTGVVKRSDPEHAPGEGWFEDEHTEFINPEWLTHWQPLPTPPAALASQAVGVGK